MARICRECGKKIVGSIAKHYEEKHFSSYLANKSKIETNPSVFAPSEDNVAEIRVIKAHNNIRASYKRTTSSSAQTVASHDKAYTHRRGMFKLVLEEYPEVMTRKDEKIIHCQVCTKEHKHGKIILSTPKWKVCYDCYNAVKAEIPPKPRPRRVLYAGIPGLGKKH